mmetsp:Transcript_7247/g.21384  ORF Transcript_7247/g.21384 Transcript_7247/m.21384 type:complete len:97 (-) Transcript_7247:1465-1755(-)
MLELTLNEENTVPENAADPLEEETEPSTKDAMEEEGKDEVVDVETVLEEDKEGTASKEARLVCNACNQYEPSEELLCCKICDKSYHRIKCVTPAVR